MTNGHPPNGNTTRVGPMVLVAVDFSDCSRLALRKARSWADSSGGKILVLHVIDQDFVNQCIHHRLGTEEEIKENIFLGSKKKLRAFVRKEGLDEKRTRMIVCPGTPCLEINRRAMENDVEMIIMGSKGNADDMKSIFFGSTTERVLRFIKRPVLCIPPEDRANPK